MAVPCGWFRYPKPLSSKSLQAALPAVGVIASIGRVTATCTVVVGAHEHRIGATGSGLSPPLSTDPSAPGPDRGSVSYSV